MEREELSVPSDCAFCDVVHDVTRIIKHNKAHANTHIAMSANSFFLIEITSTKLV